MMVECAQSPTRTLQLMASRSKGTTTVTKSGPFTGNHAQPLHKEQSLSLTINKPLSHVRTRKTSGLGITCPLGLGDSLDYGTKRARVGDIVEQPPDVPESCHRHRVGSMAITPLEWYRRITRNHNEKLKKKQVDTISQLRPDGPAAESGAKERRAREAEAKETGVIGRSVQASAWLCPLVEVAGDGLASELTFFRQSWLGRHVGFRFPISFWVGSMNKESTDGAVLRSAEQEH